MDEREILRQYENLIQNIQTREPIRSLSDFDNVKFEDTNALDFSYRISATRNTLKAQEIDIDLMIHDLIYSVSSDIRFSLSSAYLYFPYANNFTNDIIPFGTTGINAPTYFRRVEDKRFFFFVNTTFEKLYMFWDRVAALLNESLNLEIPKDKVYFAKVVEALERKGFVENQHGKWLKNFHDNEYRTILNYLRKKIVHYRQKDTYFFMSWVDASRFYNDDPSLLDTLQREKEELLPLLKNQMELTLTGFESSIKLVLENGPYENRDPDPRT